MVNNTKVKFCSLEDLIIFKTVAERAIDLYDVRNVILRNSKFDKRYVMQWLKKFEKTTGEMYIERFEKILNSIK